MNDRKLIIAIPFAGGNRFSYRKMEEEISNDFEWKTMEYPHRNVRLKKKSVQSIQAIAKDILVRIDALINTRDYIIYGHSMGGLIGYEVMKLILNERLKCPLFIFFTGIVAPEKISNRRRIHENKDLWRQVKEMGGISNVLFMNKKIKNLYEPIIRADISIFEKYKYTPFNKKIPIPIYIAIGDQENIPEVDVLAWNNETNIPIQVHILKGNHFFILHQPKTLINIIERALAH